MASLAFRADLNGNIVFADCINLIFKEKNMNSRSTSFRTKTVGVAVALLVAASAISIGSASTNTHVRIAATAYASETLPQRDLSLQRTRQFLKLAQTHADICLENEQQCLQGCDGAQSCSDQCGTNYEGCMNQGG